MKKHIRFVILMFSIFIVGCSGAQSTNGEVDVNNDLILKDVQTPDSNSLDIVEINVNAFRFGFDPKTITVKQGQTVRLTAQSLDVPHGLAIPDYKLDLYLNGLQSKTIEFVADKKGEFAMICSVPCGAGHNSMQGTFIVN